MRTSPKLISISTRTCVLHALFLLLILSMFTPYQAIADTAAQYISQAGEYIRVGDMRRAERAYLLAQREDPDAYDAYLGLVDLYLAQRRYEKALESVDQALAAYSQDPQLWIRRGVILRDSGDVIAAKTSFKQATVFASDDIEVLRVYEGELQHMGDVAEAEEIGAQRLELESQQQ